MAHTAPDARPIVYPREIHGYRTELTARRRSRYRRNVTIVHLDDLWWVVPNELGAHDLAYTARRHPHHQHPLAGLYGRARRALAAARAALIGAAS